MPRGISTFCLYFQALFGTFFLKVFLEWVVPEKIHTPPTDGILGILVGGGVEDSGNPGGRGG